MKIGKKAEDILTENVVFIIITLLFISILFIFVSRAASTTNQIEEAQAKKMALIIDSSRPGTKIIFNVQDVFEKKAASIKNEDVFSVDGNKIIVKLNENSGYSYSFFNDVSVDLGKQAEGYSDGYIKIIIEEKNEEIVENAE